MKCVKISAKILSKYFFYEIPLLSFASTFEVKSFPRNKLDRSFRGHHHQIDIQMVRVPWLSVEEREIIKYRIEYLRVGMNL